MEISKRQCHYLFLQTDGIVAMCRLKKGEETIGSPHLLGLSVSTFVLGGVAFLLWFIPVCVCRGRFSIRYDGSNGGYFCGV